MTRFHFALLLVPLLLAGACKKDPPATDVVRTTVPSDLPKDQPQAVEALKRNFERVGFEYDSARLTASAKSALAKNAEILQAWPDITVEVQGHCDERGTTEYNIALGEKRAQAVQEYLAMQGVGKARLSVVSYGEERPLVSGGSETAWAQNRRAEFRIKSGNAAGVAGTTM